MVRHSYAADKSDKPVLAVTMGDAAGIGPEVVLKALANPGICNSADFLIVGDYNWLEKTRCSLGLKIELARLKNSSGRTACGEMSDSDTAQGLKSRYNELRKKLAGEKTAIICLDLANLPKQGWRPGRVNKACGRASVEYIESAADLALSSVVGAIVTAPISKEAVHRAGCRWPGHTELLAHRAGTGNFAMMLSGRGLRVVLVTTHLALSQVSLSLSVEDIFKKIKLTHVCLRRYFGIEKPRIAVCGLNPHCGESGAFGTEEAEFIAPAILASRRAKIKAVGPLAADTVFYQAVHGKFDAVIAMYHDQGLGPLKLYAFDEGVNVTLGLPFIRTSPDHGTAFDIAGRNLADSRSMEQAVITAIAMLKHRC